MSKRKSTMYEFQEPEVHRGGYAMSKEIDESFKQDLLRTLSSEIRNLRREINSMEGKYISLLAYYQSVVEKNPDFLRVTSEVS
jgi:hypothetical protein